MHVRSESGLFGPQEYLLRPVMQCWLGEHADLAFGAAAHATNENTGAALTHWSWPLSWRLPVVGSSAATYAFPNHAIKQATTGQSFQFSPALYPGEVLQVGDYRDARTVPYPYLHVGIHIHPGASGGPVAVSGEGVVGVNCRYMDPDGPGTAAQIRCLQDSSLDHAVLIGETEERRVTFAEFVAKGAITARGFSDNSVPAQPGRIVRLDVVPISAPGPSL
jgi:hypothetical protein